jgi:hypothetical protein
MGRGTLRRLGFRLQSIVVGGAADFANFAAILKAQREAILNQVAATVAHPREATGTGHGAAGLHCGPSSTGQQAALHGTLPMLHATGERLAVVDRERGVHVACAARATHGLQLRQLLGLQHPGA